MSGVKGGYLGFRVYLEGQGDLLSILISPMIAPLSTY